MDRDTGILNSGILENDRPGIHDHDRVGDDGAQDFKLEPRVSAPEDRAHPDKSVVVDAHLRLDVASDHHPAAMAEYPANGADGVVPVPDTEVATDAVIGEIEDELDREQAF